VSNLCDYSQLFWILLSRSIKSPYRFRRTSWLQILQRDAYAVVVFVSCDHYYSDAEACGPSYRSAGAEQYPDSIVLVSAKPTTRMSNTGVTREQVLGKAILVLPGQDWARSSPGQCSGRGTQLVKALRIGMDLGWERCAWMARKVAVIEVWRRDFGTRQVVDTRSDSTFTPYHSIR